MNPYYFRCDAAPLFAVHHPSERRSTRGVVLLNPLGQEALRIHRTYRQLAARLAARGLHVLRFDWSATGDSAGGCDEASLLAWRRDVADAVGELVERAGVDVVHLVGLRVGACLAREAVSRLPAVAGAVLWDPIVDGAAYLAEAEGPGAGEVAGHPLSTALRAEIATLGVASAAAPSGGVLLLLGRAPALALRELQQALSRDGARIELRETEDADAWDDPNEFSQGRLPHDAITVIETWLADD